MDDDDRSPRARGRDSPRRERDEDESPPRGRDRSRSPASDVESMIISSDDAAFVLGKVR